MQTCTIRVSNDQTASYALDMALAQYGLIAASAEHMLMVLTGRSGHSGRSVKLRGHENIVAIRNHDPDCRFVVTATKSMELVESPSSSAPSTRRHRTAGRSLFGQLRSKSKSSSTRSLDSATSLNIPSTRLFGVPLSTLVGEGDRLPKAIMASFGLLFRSLNC